MTNASSLLLLATLLCGCGALDNCPDGQSEPIRITGRSSDPEGQLYVSAPWSSLDAFPAKTALAFEHGLGFTPAVVLPYLSFAPVGTNDSEGGSVALSAGNQTLVDCVDSRVIVIRNDTCEEHFYIRVTAFGVGEDQEEACSGPAE
ncbi:MAG: hypothetical protein EOO73_28400 [Myxococcales bacterium]|nr:MAG: hypothetical protein EOO73_28400 [Myxococcales bacterium]